MALRKKVKDETKIEQTEQAVEETKEESEAIIAQQEKDKEAGASTKKLEKVTALVSGKFNLDDNYAVTNFKDGGKTIDLTLENKDFVLSVKVKDSARHGLVFEE